MSGKNYKTRFLWALCLVIFLIGNNFLATSQTQERERNREVINPTITGTTNKNNDKVSTDTTNKKTDRTNKITPKKASGVNNKPNPNAAMATLDLTIWEVKPETKNDKPDDKDTLKIAKVIGHEDKGTMIGKKLEGKVELENTGLLRFSVQTNRSGYVYVFDREMYTETTYSEPYLIYPIILKDSPLPDQNNYITPNQTLSLPRQKESYCLEVSNVSSTGFNGKTLGEEFIILVSPEPLNLKPVECIRENSSVQCPPVPISPSLILINGKNFKALLEKWSNGDKDKLPPQKNYTFARKSDEPYLVRIPVYVKATPDKNTGGPKTLSQQTANAFVPVCISAYCHMGDASPFLDYPSLEYSTPQTLARPHSIKYGAF